MLFYKTFEIADNERALLFRKKRFHKVLKAGTHRYFGFPAEYHAEVFDITRPEFTHPLGEFLYREHTPVLERYMTRYQLGDLALGLVFFDNKLVDIIAPGETRFYWKGAHEVRVEMVAIDVEFELTKEQKTLLREARALRSGKTRGRVRAVPGGSQQPGRAPL